jgi:rhomboid family GlyGly-CTERM serine protease
VNLKSWKMSSERTISWVTIGLLSVLSLIALSPRFGPILVYDRTAILRGEIWRLATGNLVHFSATHFLFDTLALGIAGVMIERRGYRGFTVLCVIASLGIGCALLLFQPQTNVYGGASGMATAAIVFLALHGLRCEGAYRWVCGAALVGVATKIVLEVALGHSLFLTQADSAFVNCPLSHLVGALAAVAVGSITINSMPRRGECRWGRPSPRRDEWSARFCRSGLWK